MATVSLGTIAQVAGYQFDPAISFVEIQTQHLGFSWLAGRCNKIDGVMTFVPTQDAEYQGLS